MTQRRQQAASLKAGKIERSAEAFQMNPIYSSDN
jgi:hypothetical protein